MAKSKFKLPVLAKNKNVNIALYVLIAGAIVFLLYKAFLYFKNRNTIDQTTSTSNGSTSGLTANNSTAGTKTVAYTDSSVFSTKSPYMKDKRVQWMQNSFNTYSKMRNQYGKTPDWGTITEDSSYGPKTANAMNRLMGKKTVTWSEVRTRTEYLKNQLNQSGNGSGGNW